MTETGSSSARSGKSCHERALGLLAVRARSRRELERRLLGAGFDPEEVDDVLARLEGVGLLDDAAFARQVAEHAFGVRRAGRRGVWSTLAAKGVAAEIIEEVIAEAGGDEERRAAALAESRVARLRAVELPVAFARLTAFLVRRGYSADVARQAARGALGIDPSGASLASAVPPT